ncbi:MAG TPA: hypothetical protein VFA36_07620, partial [Burkholderiales bacterium]|nr:hypothetical protein [Burkholderiales bacterium]
EEAKRQLQSQRAAEARAKAEAQAEAEEKAASEAKARTEAKAKARPPAEVPRRTGEPPVAVARKEPDPQPRPATPAAPAQEAPRTTFLPSILWGSAKPAQQKPPASPYDGAWTATRSCDAIDELPSRVSSWKLNVVGGEFSFERGTPGQPGYNQARGKPGDDGSLVLSGNGVSDTKRTLGGTFTVFFQGRYDGERFVLKGTQGSRACTLVLTRG